MREHLRATSQAATAELLRSQAGPLAVEWAVEFGADHPLPDPTAVIHALADGIAHGPTVNDEAPPQTLRALARSLVDTGTSLDIVVGHLAALREAFHRRVVVELPAANALIAQHEFNGAIDVLVQMCATGATGNLERAAFVDPLTGLLNRRALKRDLDRELALAVRHDRSVSMVVGDLDGLKTINDTRGHTAGDDALRALAGALATALRSGDAAYRVGGDEFVMLLTASSATHAAGVVARVKAAGAPAFGWGSATFPEDGNVAEELLDLADRRLLARRRTDRATPAPAMARASGHSAGRP
ncbi:MAG: GGDEF domain-containing protein, partial [Acidimicrobiales bacterium]